MQENLFFEHCLKWLFIGKMRNTDPEWIRSIGYFLIGHQSLFYGKFATIVPRSDLLIVQNRHKTHAKHFLIFQCLVVTLNK
jgi:hypothetical protein